MANPVIVELSSSLTVNVLPFKKLSEGDVFYVTDVTNGNSVGSKIVNIGDTLVALADSPENIDTNWLIMESNRDQSSEQVKGVAKIATDALTNSGRDDATIITPLKLENRINNIGLTKVIAGNGLIENLSGKDKTLDIVSANAAITINSDDIELTIGSANGQSLEVSTGGLELKSEITGARKFTTGNSTFTINSVENKALLTSQPDGSESLAISTTKYADDQVYKYTRDIRGEVHNITNMLTTTVTLDNTPTLNKEAIYLNGSRMARGSVNDYTISGNIITFNFNLHLSDVVVVDYLY